MKIKISIGLFLFISSCGDLPIDKENLNIKNSDLLTELRGKVKKGCEKQRDTSYVNIFSKFCINENKRESICDQNGKACKPYGIILRKLKKLNFGDTIRKSAGTFDITIYPVDGGASYIIKGPAIGFCEQENK